MIALPCAANLFRIGVLIGIAWCSISSIAAGPLDTWHTRNPIPSPNRLHSVTYGNGLWIAVGAGSTLVSSSDGTNWLKSPPIENQNFFYENVKYGNGKFLVHAYTNLFSSPDGVSWTRELFPQTVGFLGPVFLAPARLILVNGRFFAFGYGGLIMSSSTGANWTVHKAVDRDSLEEVRAIAFGNSRYVAVTPRSVIFADEDDLDSWTTQSTGGELFLKDAVFRDGRFLAVGGMSPFASGRPHDRIFESQDGTSWSEVSRLPGEGVRIFNTRRGLVVVPDDWQDGIMISQDGISWQQVAMPSETTIYDLAQSSERIMTVGYSSWARGTVFAGAILATEDGLRWERRDRGFHNLVEDIIYADGKFVAVSGIFTTNATVAVSTNGVDWTVTNLESTDRLRSIAYGNGTYVITARSSGANPATTIHTSPDALTWSKQSAATNIPGLVDITFGAGKFMAVGSSNSIAQSPDGRIWQTQSLDNSSTLHSIAYGNGVFVAVGHKPVSDTNHTDNFVSSADGINWTRRTTGRPSATTRVLAFGNGRFVAVGVTNSFTSSNGVDWESHPFTYPAFKEKLVFGGGHFVMATRSTSDGGVPFHNILSSTDGITWTVRQTGSDHYLWAVAYGANTFVVTTDLGGILQSDPFAGGAALTARYLSASKLIELGRADVNPGVLTVQRTSDLTNSVWDSIGTLQPGSTFLETSTAPRRFYRAIPTE